MAANETMELVVAVSPEGTDETSDALEDVEDGFQETADTAEETSGDLDEFSRRWKGAMNVITASLAIAAAGLLTQVPIVSDLMDGLMAIVESVGLQIDDLLRPALGGLTNDLFEIAEAIEENEGPLGTVVGLLGTLTILLGGLRIGVLAADILTFGKASAFLAPKLSAAATTISGFVSSLLSIPAVVTAAAVAIGVFVGTLGVAILEALGVMDAIEGLGEMLSSELPANIRNTLILVLGVMTGVLGIIGAFIAGFVQGTLQGGLVQGFQTGVQFVQEYLNILKLAFLAQFGEITDILTRFVTKAKGLLNSYVAFVRTWRSKLTDVFATAAENAADALLEPIENALDRARSIADQIASIASSPGRAASGAVNLARSRVPGLQSGGRIVEGGLARVHAGEEIMPAAQVNRSANPQGSALNRFANGNQIQIEFKPRAFERFVSAQLEDSPMNTGRSAGPQD